MTRTGRFLGGIGFGYINIAISAIAGIFLTRFFLKSLGAREYGSWLLAMQINGYSALLDLGILAILPREIALLTGRDRGWRQSGSLADLVGGTTRLLLWQVPFLFMLMLAALIFLPADWEPLRWPLAMLFASTILWYPLRAASSVLAGLQDLSFVGIVSLLSWALSMSLTVGLLLAGFGLFALSAGVALSQLSSAVACVIRLRRRFPGALPGRRPRNFSAWRRAHMGKATWVGVSQFAQLLLAGTDALIVGALLGPAAVVLYTCTGKLFAVLGNQPTLLSQAAVPGLSEIRGESNLDRVFSVTDALGQAMLTMTGAIVCTVIVINGGFVTWWVGNDQFGGLGLTVLLAVQLFLRHWNVSLTYALFTFGNERRIALTSLLDGMVSVVAALLLGRVLGVLGIPLGGMAGVVLVSLPLNVAAISRAASVPSQRVLLAHARWVWRFGVLAVIATAVASYWTPPGVSWIIVAALATLGLYTLVLIGPTLRPPLGQYVRPRLDMLLRRKTRSRTTPA